MGTPCLKINVIPSMALVKSHYISTGQFLGRFYTSMPIDSTDFSNLDSAQRALIFGLFEDSGVLLSIVTIDIVVDEKMVTTKAIVHALIQQLAQTEQAMIDRLVLDWDGRVVQFADQDSGEDPPF